MQKKAEENKVLAGSLELGDRFKWGLNTYEVFRIQEGHVLGHCDYPKGSSQVMGVPVDTEVTHVQF